MPGKEEGRRIKEGTREGRKQERVPRKEGKRRKEGTRKGRMERRKENDGGEEGWTEGRNKRTGKRSGAPTEQGRGTILRQVPQCLHR